MNRVYSTKEPMILNGEHMAIGDFGVVRKAALPYLKGAIGKHVIKTKDFLVCLEAGGQTTNPEMYEVEIKDNLNLQRIK